MGLLNKLFFNIGHASASNPFTACFFAFMLTLVFGMGFLNMEITVKLYSYFNNAC
jgi:predicted RND superfamily exporter protein